MSESGNSPYPCTFSSEMPVLLDFQFNISGVWRRPSCRFNQYSPSFWPCRVWDQVPALQANSCPQQSGQMVYCAGSTSSCPDHLSLSSPPHSILISGRVSSQLVRILRIHFFVYLNFSLPFSASVPVFYDSYLFEEDWLLAWKLLFLTLIAYKQTSTSAGDDLQFVFNLCEPSHKWGQSLSYTSVSSLPFFNKGWELNLHPLNWPAAHVEK